MFVFGGFHMPGEEVPTAGLGKMGGGCWVWEEWEAEVAHLISFQI